MARTHTTAAPAGVHITSIAERIPQLHVDVLRTQVGCALAVATLGTDDRLTTTWSTVSSTSTLS